MLAAGSRGRRQVVVGGSRSWEGAGNRGRYESEAFSRPEYISVATRQQGRGWQNPETSAFLSATSSRLVLLFISEDWSQ
jgi:uncharacterized protein (DUF952 family)